MAQNDLYIGYSGVIWQTVYSTMSYYTEQLAILLNENSGNAQAPAITLLSEGMLDTLLNATQAININTLATAWTSEFANLQSIQALPLSVPASAATLFNARVAAYGSGLPTLNALVPQPPYGVASGITNGIPSIPYTDLLNYFQTFSFETPPSGLTSANLLTEASAVGAAMQVVANAISVYQGNNITNLYDVAQFESFAANFASGIIADFTSGPLATDITTVNSWNQIVALPAMVLVGELIGNVPFLQASQQQAVIRNTMLTFAGQVELLLLSLRQPIVSQVNLTTLRVGETLLDVAARTTGNFEDWVAIAALNGLMPPYVGAVTSAGIAGWGSQLVLPTPGVQVAAAGAVPSYANNFLGIDLYIGPINGVMPVWTGDFQTIAGYNNLAWALGRRLQTTQGSLLYHPQYGSRIPPQVGNVQTNQTAGHIAAFGKSAILSDPRVASCPSAQAQLQSNGKIGLSANVQPSGFQSASVTLNEVIGPLV